MRPTILFLALHASVLFGGDNWVALTPIDAPLGTLTVAADPFAPDTLYANVFFGRNSGMSKSIDGGRSWNALPFSAELLVRIVVERSAPNRVTAVSFDPLALYSVYRSVDGGMTWARYQFSINGLLNDIAVDPQNSNILYAAHARVCITDCVPNSGGVNKSIDGGRHWTALFTSVGVDQILIDPLGSGTIYAIGATSSRRSQNGGLTWTTFGPDEPIYRMALDPVVPDRLYVSTVPGFFWRSDDRGETWHRLSALSSFYGWTIAIDPMRQDVIVLSSGNSGVIRSTDGGLTWQLVNAGLSIPRLPAQLDSIRIFFASNGKLYGAAAFQGVMRLNSSSEPRREAVRH